MSEPGDPTAASADSVDPAVDPTTDPAVDRAVDRVIDLDAIERDLNAVEVALGRLDDGTYWTDEITGQPMPDEVLVHDPIARRA